MNVSKYERKNRRPNKKKRLRGRLGGLYGVYREESYSGFYHHQNM